MYLRVASLEYRRIFEVTVAVEGMAVTGGRVFEVAPEGLRNNVGQPDVFKPREAALPPGPALR